MLTLLLKIIIQNIITQKVYNHFPKQYIRTDIIIMCTDIHDVVCVDVFTTVTFFFCCNKCTSALCDLLKYFTKIFSLAINITNRQEGGNSMIQ